MRGKKLYDSFYSTGAILVASKAQRDSSESPRAKNVGDFIKQPPTRCPKASVEIPKYPIPQVVKDSWLSLVLICCFLLYVEGPSLL